MTIRVLIIPHSIDGIAQSNTAVGTNYYKNANKEYTNKKRPRNSR